MSAITCERAVEVKYIRASQGVESGWKASCFSGSITVDNDRTMNMSDNAEIAARALSDKLGWSRNNVCIMGQTKKKFVFLFVPKGHLHCLID